MTEIKIAITRTAGAKAKAIQGGAGPVELAFGNLSAPPPHCRIIPCHVLFDHQGDASESYKVSLTSMPLEMVAETNGWQLGPDGTWTQDGSTWYVIQGQWDDPATDIATAQAVVVSTSSPLEVHSLSGRTTKSWTGC